MTALPAGIATVQITGELRNPDGSPASGSIDFIPSVRVVHVGEDVIVLPAKVTARLVDGAIPDGFLVPAGDDGNPSGWTLRVVERIGSGSGSGSSYNISLLSANGPTQDLSSLAPVTSDTGLPVVVGPAGPSAYDVAVAAGFVGSEAQWLASLAVSATTDASELTSGLLPDARLSGTARASIGAASPADVAAAVAALVNAAPGTLDTLGELATALQAGDSAAAALVAEVATKTTPAAAAAAAAALIAAQHTADNATFLTILGPSNGVNDAAWINAKLAVGGTFKGLQGQSYLISTALILPANTTLDMTGCTVTLIPESPSGPLLRNAAATPTSTIAGCSSVAGSNVLTGTGFTAEMTGKAVGLAGGGEMVFAARGAWFGKFTYVSPTSGTISPVVSAVGATVLNAAATVAGAVLSIYDRDNACTAIGGTWVRTTTDGGGGDGNWHHTMFFRHTSDLTVKGCEYLISGSINAKYALAIGDFQGVTVADLTFDTKSDGCHFSGPGRGAQVDNLHGTTRDDMLSFTPNDYGAYADVSGDIFDCFADGIDQDGLNGGVSAVKADCCSPQAVIRKLHITNVSGSSVGRCIAIGSNNDDLSVRLSNITIRTLSDTAAVFEFSGNLARTIEIDGFSVHVSPGRLASSPLISVFGLCEELIVRNVTAAYIGSVSFTTLSIRVANLSVTPFVHVDNWHYRSIAAGNLHVPIELHSAATRVLVTSTNIENVNYFVYHKVATKLTLIMSGVTVLNAGTGIVDTVGSVDLTYSGCSIGCYNAYVRTRALTANTITVRGAGLLGFSGAGDSVVRSGQVGALTMKVYDPQFPVDVSLTTKANGTAAYNTNAALACGVGPVVSDGTNWKNLYSGVVY